MAPRRTHLQWLGRGGVRAAWPPWEEAVHGAPGGAAQVGDPCPGHEPNGPVGVASWEVAP